MKLWSRLAEATKKKYRAKGVTPQRYNAWNKTSAKTKSKLAAKGVSRDEFLKAPTTKQVVRTANINQVINRLKTMLPRASAKAIERNVPEMDGQELFIASKASLSKLRKMASAKGYKPVVWSKEPINPFWYR